MVGRKPEFMVERYVAGITTGDVAASAARLNAVTSEMRGEGIDILYLGSTFVPSEGSVFSRFHASSPEGVEEANRRAGLPFHRIIEAISVE
jgi:hypothetical protein